MLLTLVNSPWGTCLQRGYLEGLAMRLWERGEAQGSTGFLLLNLHPQTPATMWGEWGRFV